MKTHTTLRKLTLTAAALASVSVSEAINRTLILLQEDSSDTTHLAEIIADGTTLAEAEAIVADTIRDQSSETTTLFGGTTITSFAATEAPLFEKRATEHYQRFVNLSDGDCTRARLLAELIQQSKEGYTVDLAILGGGSTECLELSNGETLTGRTTRYLTLSSPTYSTSSLTSSLTSSTSLTTSYSTSTLSSSTLTSSTISTYSNSGTIRSLLTDARAQEGERFQFKLRLVYMGNSRGATTNDDWLAIGAETAVGCPTNNFMPEPMISAFWDGFLEEDKPARQAADDSLALARSVYDSVEGYHVAQANGLTPLEETRQETAGNGDLIFRDECLLPPGQSRWIHVSGNSRDNVQNVYLEAGESYTFSVPSGSTWSNGSITGDANGHAPTSGTESYYRRYPTNIMKLMGERFSRQENDPAHRIADSGFSVGTSRTLIAPGHGFLNLFANDWVYTSYYGNTYTGYGNNAGFIWVKITHNLPVELDTVNTSGDTYSLNTSQILY